ncbi:MAG: AMP-binding protein, partial [Rhizobiaceae bacterium]
MDRFWTKNYPAGVPENINVDEFSSLVDLLENSFKQYRDNNAYVFMDKFMTYGDIDEKSKILAAYFQNLGLKQGDRVAIMMPNVLQYPVTTAAVLRAGLIVVNVKPLYTARELEHQLNDAGAETIVSLENVVSVLQEGIGKTKVK